MVSFFLFFFIHLIGSGDFELLLKNLMKIGIIKIKIV